ncbi:MAG: glycosyltransferase family 39 protein [Caldilineaceae bacterium]
MTGLRRHLPTILGLLALLVFAAWMRWRYATEISLYVDEFTTLWAAKRVMASGVPIMPSGVLYTRGLLATYVTALAGLLAGGLTYTVGRLPSLLFGLACIVAIFAAGRREWNSRVGWLAALGLALLPEAIVWSARARFYAQLQLFALLTMWAAYAAIQYMDTRRGTRSGGTTQETESLKETQFLTSPDLVPLPIPSLHRHLLFAVLFVLALFSQEQMVLLYPSILLAMLVWRGWRYLFRPQVWPAQAICLAAMGVRFAIEILGQPGYFETIQSQRPYVGLIFDLSAAWSAYANLLIAPERLPWTLFGLLAVAVAVAAWAKARWRMAAVAPYHQATLFFTFQFLFMLGFILFFVGGQWRETRYLFLVQPAWLLAGAAGAVWGIDWLLARLLPSISSPVRWRWAATGLVALLLALSLWQPAQAVLGRQVEGYDKVLAYVAEQRQPGDVVMSPQPPACAFVLGPCDYYAVQRVYEEFVVPKGLADGGELVDRWSGARLLNDAATLAEVMHKAPAVWFVTDRFRLATRYDEAFLRTVLEQFDISFEERGVVALRAQGWREEPAMVVDEALPAPLAAGPLSVTRWAHTAAIPGQDLAVTLTWQATAPIDRQINTSFRLVDGEGKVVAQQDGPPARGIIPTNLFFATPLPDSKTLHLPGDLAPGQYLLQVVAYDVDTVTPLSEPLVVGTLEITD